MQALQALYFCF